jgi:cyclophilin family peptidyl-prolyl cis-trans isomerase
MAQHKAPTAVTIARTQEGWAFTHWVERYWKLGALILAVGAAALLFFEYRQGQEHVARGDSWNQVMAITQTDEGGFPRGDPAALQALAGELSGADAAPWALYLAAISALNRSEYDAAQNALNELRTTYAGHPLVTTPYPFEETAAPQTIPDRLEAILARQQAWEREHPGLYENQAPATDAPRVRLVTDAGTILVALYPEQAPKHVENFLKLCNDGFYNGLAFHRVIPDFMIQAGDPNTKDADTTLWGQGGPGYNVESEQNDLRHFPGYLSAAKKQGEKDSSGSQFFITTAAAHHLDGEHVVFGKVLEGMETVRAIEAGATVEGTDRPINPIRITSTEAL